LVSSSGARRATLGLAAENPDEKGRTSTVMNSSGTSAHHGFGLESLP
jgi:hypothetical protein